MGGLILLFHSTLSAAVCYTDIKYLRIPDFLTFGAFLGGLIIYSFTDGRGPLPYLSGSVAGLLTYGAVYWLSRKKLGMGDVKLSLYLGGITGIPGWYITNILASAGALAFFLVFKVKGRNIGETPLPFGPFLCLGALAFLFMKYFGYLPVSFLII